MSQVLRKYWPVVSRVPSRVLALASVLRDEPAGQQAAAAPLPPPKPKGGMFGALLGMAKTATVGVMKRDHFKYIALSDQHTLHVLDMTDGAVVQRDDFAINDMTGVRVTSDDALIYAQFQVGEKPFALRIQRFQLPQVYGEMLEDQLEVAEVGHMTAAIEAAIRSRA